MKAIKTVLEKKIYLSDEIQKKIMDARFGKTSSSKYSLIENLSRREFETLQYIGQGFGATEIAGILNLSVKTVHNYRDHLKSKLDLDSSKDLRRFAIKWYQSLNSSPADR